MTLKKNIALNVAVSVAILAAISISLYAIWQVEKYEKKSGELDNAVGVLQRRTDAMETHVLNLEMTNFQNVTSARLAFNLNRRFIFYGRVDQDPVANDVVVSLFTASDFFTSRDPELEKSIVNLIKQHTIQVLETVKFTSRLTQTKINSTTINYLDNTNPKNLLAQYKNKKLKVRLDSSFTPVPLNK